MLRRIRQKRFFREKYRISLGAEIHQEAHKHWKICCITASRYSQKFVLSENSVFFFRRNFERRFPRKSISQDILIYWHFEGSPKPMIKERCRLFWFIELQINVFTGFEQI